MTKEPTPANYDAMTNAQLNIEVAKRLGYEFDEFEWGWRVKTPDEMKWGMQDGEGVSSEAVYNYHAKLGNVPNWADDANAALTLLEGLFSEITIFADKSVGILVGESRTNFVKPPDNVHERLSGMARLICLAWLEWQDEQ